MTDITPILTMIRNTQRWDYYVTNPNAPKHIEAITETVERVMEHLSTYTESSIDLTQYRAENVSGEHLAAVLRVTSRFRDTVPGWWHGLQLCTQLLSPEQTDLLPNARI